MLRYIILFALQFVFFLVSHGQSASFSANQTSGCPNPFLLIVNSTSTGGPFTSYSWTLTGPAGFTPQSSSTNQLSTTLTIPGFYTVELTVCAGGNCDTEVQTNYIEVFSRPTINMNISPLSGCPPHEVCFDGTFDPVCGTITSSVIDVRDGTTYNNVEDVCHTYTSSGNYTNFLVSVTNSCGCTTSSTLSDVVSVTSAPVANFTSSNTSACNPPLTVNFSNTSTNTTGGSSYEWNIPGEVNGATTQNISNTFNSAGSYDVQLIVTNPNSCSDTLTLTDYIVIGNQNANFSSSDSTVCLGDAVSFSDLSSGTPDTWLWTFEGHGTSNNQNPTVNFNTVGTWDVTLDVTYPGGCTGSITLPNFITVNDAPVNSFTVSDSGSCQIPFTTTFTSTATNATSTTWTFPGGTPNTHVGNGPVNVTYNALGNYNVQMSSTNAGGCVSNTTFSNVITVSDLQITLLADEQGGCIPHNPNLSYTLSPNLTVANQTWTLSGSDIGSSNIANPSPTYSTEDCFDVELEVTTTDGCVASITENNFICAGTQPTNTFSFTPSSVCFEDEEVCLTYTGAGADTIFWDFGDPSPPVWTADDESPCYIYSQETGDFTLTMVAINNGCAADTAFAVDAITVNNPIASFTSDFMSCSSWNTFNFTDASTGADSVYYVFGDPSTTLDTSTQRNPQWTYPLDSNTYTVTQYAYNFTTGCEHEVSNTIAVYPPNADFTFQTDTTICVGSSVSVSNTSLELSGVRQDTRWDWDGTLTYMGFPAIFREGPNKVKPYDQIGVYTVSMTNTDTRGCTDTITKTNSVYVHGVLPNFSSSTNAGCGPLNVSFFDSSEAPISFINSWSWDFGDTTTLSDTSNLQNPGYTYTLPGTYIVTLTATDSFGCSAIAFDTIRVLGPTASFSVSDTFICNNQSISLTNNSTGFDLSYDWQFDSGASPPADNTDTPPNVTYSTEGVKDIFLEITDSVGCTDDTTIQVHVLDPVLQANSSLDSISCFSNITPVSFSNNSINNIDSSSVFWDFGNGVTSTSYNPSVVYNIAGTYEVSMSLASRTGCRDTAIVDTIYVGGPYADIQVLSSDSICSCEQVEFEITTLNSSNATFISGDGGSITYTPNGLPGDTIRDTIMYQYCPLGNFVPQVFIDDGTCSGNLLANDTIYVDSLIVDFTIPSFSLCDTGTICFTDLTEHEFTSSLPINSWSWDFGDGNTSTDQNPCHTFVGSGFYDIKLVVQGSVGCSDSITKRIYIPPTPVAQIARSDTNGCVGLEVNFWDSTSIGPNTVIQSWQWDFGQTASLADTANTQDATFTFTNPGTFWVTLSIIDTFGCSSIDSVQIDVFDIPLVDAGSDIALCAGDSAELIATGADTYQWLPNYNILFENTDTPLVYPSVDTFYYVTGTSLNGCGSSDTVFVDVNSIQASFSLDTVCLGLNTTFTDNSTSDGNITNWSWDFGEPASGANNTSGNQNPTHTYLSTGVFPVSLSVTDDLTCTSDTILQAVVLESPEASFIADSVCFGLSNNFDSGLSSAGIGATITDYFWDFGQNPEDTSRIAAPTFTYDSPGFYNVCLTITTDQNCTNNTDDTCFIVQVFDIPTAEFSVDSVCLGTASLFENQSQAGSDAAITNTFWDFGQNTQDTLAILGAPSDTPFTYDTSGVYSVNLTLTDANSCSASFTQDALVFDVPTAGFTFTSSCQFQENTFVATTGSLSANATYEWNFDEGAGFVSGDSVETYSFVNSGPHDVALVVFGLNNCTDTVVNTINVSESPTAIIEGDSLVCEGTSTQLSGVNSISTSPIVNYEWNISTSQTSNVTYLPNGDNIVTLTITNAEGCVDSSSLFIDVVESPEVMFTATPACEDLPITFEAEVVEGDAPINDFEWTIIDNNNNTTTFSTNPIDYTALNIDTLNATVEVTDDNGCTDSSSEIIFVDEQVNVSVLQSDFLLCPDETLFISLNDTNIFSITGAVGSISLSPLTGAEVLAADSFALNPFFTSTYTITASSVLGNCPDDDDNDIQVNVATEPFIEINAVPNPIISGAISEIRATVVPFNFNTDSVVWDDPNGTLNTVFGFEVDATPEEETTYPVSVIYSFDSISCRLDTSVTIQVISECSNELVYVPNIFTPNNDTRNDIFKLTGYGIEVVNYLRIFDRWGQLMYEGQNVEMNNGRMTDGWRGDNKNGQACNSGVYVYQYEIICANGDVIQGSGNVTLIK